jgi:DNA-binding transcriptional ArsR family regulator
MEINDAVKTLGALAQQTRLAIFRTLVQAGPSGLSVSEIGTSASAAPATLSFHLKELAHAGLIQSRQAGRFIFYSANYQRMSELLDHLTESCCAKDGITCLPAAKARNIKPKARASASSRKKS